MDFEKVNIDGKNGYKNIKTGKLVGGLFGSVSDIKKSKGKKFFIAIEEGMTGDEYFKLGVNLQTGTKEWGIFEVKEHLYFVKELSNGKQQVIDLENFKKVGEEYDNVCEYYFTNDDNSSKGYIFVEDEGKYGYISLDSGKNIGGWFAKENFQNFPEVVFNPNVVIFNNGIYDFSMYDKLNIDKNKKNFGKILKDNIELIIVGKGTGNMVDFFGKEELEQKFLYTGNNIIYLLERIVLDYSNQSIEHYDNIKRREDEWERNDWDNFDNDGSYHPLFSGYDKDSYIYGTKGDINEFKFFDTDTLEYKLINDYKGKKMLIWNNHDYDGHGIEVYTKFYKLEDMHYSDLKKLNLD